MVIYPQQHMSSPIGPINLKSPAAYIPVFKK